MRYYVSDLSLNNIIITITIILIMMMIKLILIIITTNNNQVNPDGVYLVNRFKMRQLPSIIFGGTIARRHHNEHALAQDAKIILPRLWENVCIAGKKHFCNYVFMEQSFQEVSVLEPYRF